MRRFTAAVVLSLALGAVPTFALAQAQPPAKPKPAAAAPAAQKPATPAPAPAAQPPLVFPEGAKIAYMNIPQIAAGSGEGKASNAKVAALREKKLADLNARNKQLEAAQQKVNGGGLLTEEARAAAQKDVERIQVEIQRAQQDAESEMQDLTQRLQVDFQRKLAPIIQQIALEKGLQVLLSQTDAGLVWADPHLDLTGEIIRRFDAATAAPAAKAPAPEPQGR